MVDEILEYAKLSVGREHGLDDPRAAGSSPSSTPSFAEAFGTIRLGS
jgi:hypothetical protein